MHDYQIMPEFEKSYKEITEAGKYFCKQNNVAIVSIARNASKNLNNNLKIFDTLESLYNNCYFYIYENDSIDNTKEIIDMWAKNKSNAIFESEKLNTPYLPLSTSTTRTENLAKARNKCLEYVKNEISDKIDYVIVIDIDFINFSINGLYNSFGWLNIHEHIDAIAGFSFLMKKPSFPNGTTTKYDMLTNYDSWAYRHTWWSDTQQSGLMYWFQWWIPLVGSPLIHVNSAFGGCAIYKKKYFISGKYSGENCEHVLFHNSIKNNNQSFNLYVNPSQIMYVEI